MSGIQEEEVWKDLPDRPLYEVSNHGRVRHKEQNGVIHCHQKQGYKVVQKLII